MYSIYGGAAHLPLFHKQQFRFRGWEKNLCHLRNVDKAGGQSKSHANRHESGRVFPLARRITLVRADRVYTSLKREAYNAQNDASRLRNSYSTIYADLYASSGPNRYPVHTTLHCSLHFYPLPVSTHFVSHDFYFSSFFFLLQMCVLCSRANIEFRSFYSAVIFDEKNGTN